MEPRPTVIRCEKARRGEMIQITIKSLGKIDAVGHPVTGQHSMHHRASGVGDEHLHEALGGVSPGI